MTDANLLHLACYLRPFDQMMKLVEERSVSPLNADSAYYDDASEIPHCNTTISQINALLIQYIRLHINLVTVGSERLETYKSD